MHCKGSSEAAHKRVCLHANAWLSQENCYLK